MKKPRYETIVARFAGCKILVVGDLMVDQYIIGQVNRISPESPTMILEVESDRRVPGGAANVVNNLSALGAEVSIVGVVGVDEEGAKLRSDLAGRGVEVSGIVLDDSRPTTIKTRLIAQNRQLLRVDREQTGQIAPAIAESLCGGFAKMLDRVDAVLVSDYNKGVLTAEVGARLVSLARDKGKLLTANPKPSTASRLRGADLMTLNQSEAESLTGVRFTEDRLMEEAGARLADELNLKALVVTRGAKGLAFWQRGRVGNESTDSGNAGQAVRHVPAHPVEVYDVAGAGDTAISALTLALISDADLLEASIIANHAAACVVRKVGVATVSPAELLEDWSET